MPLGKAYNYFSLNIWVNSRTDWLTRLGLTGKKHGGLGIRKNIYPLKLHECIYHKQTVTRSFWNQSFLSSRLVTLPKLKNSLPEYLPIPRSMGKDTCVSALLFDNYNFLFQKFIKILPIFLIDKWWWDVCMYIYIYSQLFFHKQNVAQGWFFKLIWIQSFPFPRLVVQAKLKSSVCLTIYP